MARLQALCDAGATRCVAAHDPRYAGQARRTVRLFDRCVTRAGGTHAQRSAGGAFDFAGRFRLC